MKNSKSLKTYLVLWITQTFSALGSGMTNYALVLWLYMKNGSALETSLLAVCSYAPYVLMSIFAGTLSDRWNKKYTMLVCDLTAALGTLAVLLLIKTNALCPWHLYLLNAVNGLMNTVQQPAGEVAATLLVPEKYYQKTSGLRSFSQSLNSILTPVLASVLFSFGGIDNVIMVDLVTFAVAFFSLLFFIKIPENDIPEKENESFWTSAKQGLLWLKNEPPVLYLMMFLACINFPASVYDTVLPAMVLSKTGNENILGVINACAGIASLAGSVLAAVIPAPKNRVRSICITLFISMSTENFLLAFGKTPFIWCIGAILGWIVIPMMNADMDVIFRNKIPVEMQGRVFSCRNTLQFFTIPLGFLSGGVLVDKVFEPLMETVPEESLLSLLFGTGKGSGAAMLFFVIGIIGVMICVFFSIKLRKFMRGTDDKKSA